MNTGCAGKTGKIPWESVLYVNTLKVCSRQGAIQIPHLPYLTFTVSLHKSVKIQNVFQLCRVHMPLSQSAICLKNADIWTCQQFAEHLVKFCNKKWRPEFIIIIIINEFYHDASLKKNFKTLCVMCCTSVNATVAGSVRCRMIYGTVPSSVRAWMPPVTVPPVN